MKRISTWIAAPVLAVAAAQPAVAADPGIPGPFSLRAGGSASSDSNSRLGLAVGASRALGPAGRVDLDFTHQSKNGNRSQAAGVSYVHRLDIGNFYGGLGVGVFHVSVKTGGSGTSIDDDKVTLGGKVLIGLNLSRFFFIEAAFTKVGKVSGVDASSLAVMLGLRF